MTAFLALASVNKHICNVIGDEVMPQPGKLQAVIWFQIFFFKREAALSTTRSDRHKLIVRVIWGLGNELSSAVKIQFLLLCDLTGGSLLPRP